MGPLLTSIAARADELPTLPQIVVRLLTLLDNRETSAEDIHRVLERDPVLSGKVLRLVNSAFYGLPNKVTGVRQAVVILGFRTVRSLVISSSVFDLFRPGASSGFSRISFWSHSVGVASVSRLLARQEPGLDPEAAFVAGLLHDLGKLVMDQYAPQEFKQVVEGARARKLSFRQVEQELLDSEHGEIGGWLAQRWNLPSELCQAIAHHHEVAAAEDQGARLAAVVNFANYICHRKGIGQSGNYGVPSLDSDAWALLSINKDDLPRIVTSIEEELVRSQGFVSTAMRAKPR
jgi:putative nucleotidyltransferase with HDIG domain